MEFSGKIFDVFWIQAEFTFTGSYERLNGLIFAQLLNINDDFSTIWFFNNEGISSSNIFHELLT